MFSKRSTDKEIMDDLAFAGPEMDQTLNELEFINKWLGGNAITTDGLETIINEKSTFFKSSHPIAVADLGCGSGDMLRQIAIWARKKKLSVKLTGVDANSYIIDVARQRSNSFTEIEYQQLDIFSDEFISQQFDVITCTLFTHHFEDEALIKLLLQLKQQATKAILINDLHRHPLAYYSIDVLTALFSKSPMVKNDAKLSVLRSFSKKDWARILNAAGIKNYTIQWRWAFRWSLIIWQ